LRKLKSVIIASVMLFTFVPMLNTTDTDSSSTKKVRGFNTDGSSFTGEVPVKPVSPIPSAYADAKVDKIINNGTDKYNIVLSIFGDGYTAAEQDKFTKDVAATVKAIFSTYPYTEFKDRINVYRIRTNSKESGASDDYGKLPMKKVDNYFGSRFFYDGVTDRLLWCENCFKADGILNYNGIASDMTIMLVNSETYGGGGSDGFAVTSLNSWKDEIIVHEIAHALKLADEYWYSGFEAPNMTHKHNSNNPPWKPWLGYNGIGTFSFAEDSNWLHPNEQIEWTKCYEKRGKCQYHKGNHCMMEALEYPFCEVCCSAMISTMSSMTNTPFFGYNSAYTEIHLPNIDDRILSYSFYGNDSITTLSVPENVYEIGRFAFYNCSNLSSIRVPEYTEIIDSTVFYGSNKLTIYGYDDSPVIRHAKEYGHKYALIGDMDGDSIVDATDASYVLELYSLLQTGQSVALSNDTAYRADFSGDAIVDAVDASGILAYYAKIMTE